MRDVVMGAVVRTLARMRVIYRRESMTTNDVNNGGGAQEAPDTQEAPATPPEATPETPTPEPPAQQAPPVTPSPGGQAPPQTPPDVTPPVTPLTRVEVFDAVANRYRDAQRAVTEAQATATAQDIVVADLEEQLVAARQAAAGSEARIQSALQAAAQVGTELIAVVDRQTV